MDRNQAREHLLGQAGEAGSFADALNVFREDHPGPALSKALADTFGVSRRTAQRWIKSGISGRTRQGRERIVQVQKTAGERQQRKAVANRVRAARSINVGTVGVYSKSAGKRGQTEGTRNIGDQQLGPRALEIANELASAIESGESNERIEDLMEDLAMTAYFDDDSSPLGADEYDSFDLD